MGLAWSAADPQLEEIKIVVRMVLKTWKMEKFVVFAALVDYIVPTSVCLVMKYLFQV